MGFSALPSMNPRSGLHVGDNTTNALKSAAPSTLAMPLVFSYIVSLIETKSREVGFAAINLQSYEIHLTYAVDSPTYIDTRT